MTDIIQELIQKLSAARSVAVEHMTRSAAIESERWRVPYYENLIGGIDRRISAFEEGGATIPIARELVSIGLYQGVSDWCEDDAVIDAVADVEEYYLQAQKS